VCHGSQELLSSNEVSSLALSVLNADGQSNLLDEYASEGNYGSTELLVNKTGHLTPFNARHQMKLALIDHLTALLQMLADPATVPAKFQAAYKAEEVADSTGRSGMEWVDETPEVQQAGLSAGLLSGLCQNLQLLSNFVVEDEAVCKEALNLILNSIETISPAALLQEPKEPLNQLETLLVTLATRSLTLSSDKSEAKEEEKQPQEENEDVKDGMQLQRVLYALISLSLARGQAARTYNVLKTMLKLCMEDQTCDIKLLFPKMLQTLYQSVAPSDLQPFPAAMKSDDVSFDTPLEEQPKACVSDGTYLYVAVAGGVLKMGSGHNQTEAGRVYARSSDAKLQSDGAASVSLAFAAGRLYYRCMAVGSADLLVVNPDSLEVEGDIKGDGSGSIATANNSAHGCFALASRAAIVSSGENVISFVAQSIFGGHYELLSFNAAKKMAFVSSQAIKGDKLRQESAANQDKDCLYEDGIYYQCNYLDFNAGQALTIPNRQLKMMKEADKAEEKKEKDEDEKVLMLSAVVEITCGANTVYFLTNDGAVFVMSNQNSEGQLGLGQSVVDMPRAKPRVLSRNQP